MRVIQTKLDDKLVIGIVFEEEEEWLSVQDMAGSASEDQLYEFMTKRKLIRTANNFLIELVRVLREYEQNL